MLALQKKSAGPGLLLCDVPEPSLASGEVLIRVVAAGICGTDLHIAAWTPGYDWLRPLMPVTLGHEFAGTVLKVGSSVHSLRPGHRVTVNPATFCGRCPACEDGQTEECTRRGGIGASSRGAFSPLVSVPAENCYILPDHVSFEIGALVEPLCVGARAVAVGGVRKGDNVLVLGAGMIGTSIALMANHLGANAALLGLEDTERLSCANAAGIASTGDLKDGPVSALADQLLPGEIDCVFEASGSPKSVSDGLRVLKPGGTLVVTGIHSSKLDLDLTDLVRKRHQIRGSHAWLNADWLTVIDYVSHTDNKLQALITHRFPLEKALDAFRAATLKTGTKVMVYPES